MKSRIFSILFLLISTFSYAQINELGFHVGGSNYIGDVGREAYIYPNDFSYGVIYKWNVTPRIVLRGSISYIKISDNDADSSNKIRQSHNYSFKNAIKEGAVGIEFNYYDYSLTRKGWGSTPYLILEVAAFNYNKAVKEVTGGIFKTESTTSITVPVGIGYKTRLFRNVGIGLETKIRYTLRDNLDYNNPEIPILDFGNPNSNDWYVTTGINVVFGFGRKPCYSDAF